MKKSVCFLLALVLTLSCFSAYAEEGRSEPDGKVTILSRFTMDVPTEGGYAVTTNEGYSKVFPYYSDNDIDSIMRIDFVEEEYDAFKTALVAESKILEAETDLSKVSFAQKTKISETKEYKTVLGVEKCLYWETAVSVNSLLSEDEYTIICVLVPKDKGTYIFTMRSKSEEKAHEMFDLLETIEWKN